MRYAATKKCAAVALLTLASESMMFGQGRPVDWPSYGGDARRTGWERSDTRITRENVKDFKLVLKRKFENEKGGARSLTPPVIIGLLISYKGFKELGFVAGSSGGLYSLDVDLNRMFWEKRLPGAASGGGTGPCAEGLPAMPALTPPVTFGGRRPGGRTPVTPPGTPVSPGQPPTPAAKPATLPARLAGTGFGAPRPVYVLTRDGKLHQYNTSDGSDQYPALNFLAANARASTLTMNEHMIYTTTTDGCGSVADGVWAIDLSKEDPTVSSFPIKGAAVGGLGGVAVGNDGTVYVQTGPGESDAGTGKWGNALLALNGRDLKLKDHFLVSGPAASQSRDMNVTTPVVFDFVDRDVIVSAGADGSLYLLDSRSTGGSDHKTPLFKTPRLTAGKGSDLSGIWGGISSWEDADGVRWIAAPVWGALNPELKFPVTNGPTPNGSIVAFKVEELEGKTVLTPGWVSADMRSPQPPVITSGVVFTLSSGAYTRQGGNLRPGGKAVMTAVDGATGKEIYSTGDQVSAPANLTGMTVANGRVYFTTTDGTLYAFGVYMEI